VAETKPKESSSLRQPKAKKTLGLSVPPALRMPHEDLIHPEITGVPKYRSTEVPEPSEPVVSEPDNVELPEYRSTAVSEYRSTAVPESKAPKSNFYRKPNEAADALARQLSAAESKVFDQLYRLIQGFNLPERQIRIEVLRQRTGYNTDKTVRGAIAGLEAKGIIARSGHRNNPGGEVYRILSYSGTPVLEYSGKNYRSTPVKITGELNTILKDNFNDDEAYAPLLARLRQAALDVTGREASPAEAERWGELGELLVAELKIAAARTGGVSNVPAFLTEHLRRRLWKREKPELEVEAEAGKGSAPAKAGDTTKCPDCGGSNYYYPQGYENGVARCRHEKLTPAE
jgi:hypothetical protein